MIRRLFEKLKLVKPRQPHLPQTNVIGLVHFEIGDKVKLFKLIIRRQQKVFLLHCLL